MAILSIDTLMKLDRKLVEEVPTKEVKIKALSGETYIGLLATATNKKGNVDPAKTYKAQTLIVVEAMQEPPLKDKELQSHFGAVSPADLARILFPGGEMTSVFGEVAELSGYGDDEEETDEEVKNS